MYMENDNMPHMALGQTKIMYLCCVCGGGVNLVCVHAFAQVRI